ncbi:unnamed protein product [Xylocopa violacea]|uniref:Nucleolar protein 9 n=1 Tax=Xylocopa violacea TaxID=135666 RepID=A0ABP1N154_XYLVO
MPNEYGTDERGKKRKKKRSRVQMAKKFARQRNHGSDVDSDTYRYMVRILELTNNDFPTDEEKLIFVNNVYEETTGRELEYARNQVGSRILDSLLRYANFETIQRLVDAFEPSLRPLSSDRFASHVLEKIVLICADRGNGCKDGIPESDVDRYNGIALKLSRYLINNLEEFAFDTYANHLLRTVVECLGGLIDRDESNDKRKRLSSSDRRRPVVQEYKELLSETCNRLYKWPRFLEFGRDELTSGLLQSVLYSLKDTFPELAAAYVNKITNQCFKPGTEQRAADMFAAECSIRLLEACLAVADPKCLRNVHEAYFTGNLKRLSVTRNTSYSVQRLLDHCTAKEDFEKIFEEISTCFTEILGQGHTGVLVSVANACSRLETKQGAYVTELLRALRCEVNESQQHRIVACIASLKTLQEWENLRKENDSRCSISLHGSLIVQTVLNYKKPIKVVNSVLDTDGEELARMFEDPKGSRIADAFIDSKYIGEKSREKLFKKLKGHWSRLARGTHGSRTLEKIWQWAGANQRTSIMEELAAVGESLRSTKSGRIVSSKLNVPLFARNKNDWMETLGKEEKTRALFANIIGCRTNEQK